MIKLEKTDADIAGYKRFFEQNMKGFNIHPDAVPGVAKGHRNKLLRLGLWCKEYQDAYEKIKKEYMEYIDDINEFEKGELEWVF